MEIERLKGLTPQELFDEINNLKERIKQLEEQNNQFTAQIEVPPKENKIKNLFKTFGSK